MKKWYLCFLLTIFPALNWGLVLTTLDGRILTNVTVTKVEADGVRIVHDGGSGKVMFTNLSEEIQKQYKDQIDGSSREGSEERKELKDLRVWVVGLVSEKFADGLLIQTRLPEIWNRFTLSDHGKEQLQQEMEKNPPLVQISSEQINGYIAQHCIQKGEDLLEFFEPQGLIQLKDNLVEQFLPARAEGNFLLKSHPDEGHLFVGNLVCVYALPDGEFSYPTLFSRETVSAYRYWPTSNEIQLQSQLNQTK